MIITNILPCDVLIPDLISAGHPLMVIAVLAQTGITVRAFFLLVRQPIGFYVVSLNT